MFLAQEADWTALQTEVTTDPAGLGYAGKTAGQVAELLNTPGNLLPTPAAWTKAAPQVQLAKVIQWSALPDGSNPCPMANITDAANNATDGTRGLCMAALRIFGAVGTLDVSDPINLQLIDQLQTAGKITENQKATLLALGQVPATRAEQLWGAGTAITPANLGRVGIT